MKAELTPATALDTLTNTRTGWRLHEYKDMYHCEEGNFNSELLSFIVGRFPLPPIYMQEDKNGEYHAITRYSGDLLATIYAYLDADDDQRSLIRRVGETEFTVHIIRCTNEMANVLTCADLLVFNNVVAD